MSVRSNRSSDHRRALGHRGEQLAVEHLRSRGYVVIARNVRTARGEIDLIARSGGALVFVEVKTRRVRGDRAPREDQLPLQGLRPRQQGRLRRLAASWLAEQQRERPARFGRAIRFDAIGVVIDGANRLRQLDHVEDAW